MDRIVTMGTGECGVRGEFDLRAYGYDGKVARIGAENGPPYERPPLSKGQVSEPKLIRSKDAFADAGIDLPLGHRVDALAPLTRTIRLNGGATLNYDKLLLATGVLARLFPGMEGCLKLRADEDAQRIMSAVTQGARVRIVGGGIVGLELAATARRAGAEVTVVAAAGLAVENRITVDGAFCTPDPHIHIAGDCCNSVWNRQCVRLKSWKAAQDQGACAADAILGSTDAYTSVPYSWSDQYDMTLQVSGLFDLVGDIRRRETAGDTQIFFQCDTQGRLTAAAGIGPGNSAARDIRNFEKLIERGARQDPDLLANPETNLKRLLKAA